MPAALVVKDSLVVEGCRKVAVDYMTVGVGCMMAGELECRTSEEGGYNLYKVNNSQCLDYTIRTYIYCMAG